MNDVRLRKRIQVSFEGVKSMVQDQFSEEADINNIMAKYAKTGVLPDSKRQGQYFDSTDGFDFAAMQDKVLKMNEMFNDLPSEIRFEFGSPEAFYEAFGSRTGVARLEALGVLQRKQNPVKGSVAESEVQPQEKAPKAPKAKPKGEQESTD